MDDVRKSIKIYTESVRKQIKDIPDTEDAEDYSVSMPDGEGGMQENPIPDAGDRNQQLINLNIALTQAEIKPYKDEAFLAQIFVQTQEQKDCIDNIRKELTQFIMQRNHYPHMKLEIFTVNPDGMKKMLYSPIDKFKFIMESSPAIETLKENFKCDIKY